MVHNKFKISQINDEEFLNQLDELQEEYGRVSLKGVPKLDSTKEKLGNLRWCHQGNKEKHYYQGEPIPDGWLPGRCELHAERSRKSNTGRIWMNNGVDQHQVRPEDLQLYQNQGYTRGMLDRGDAWRSNVGKYPRTPEMIQNVITKRNQLFKEHPERMSSTIFKKGQPGTIKGKKSITDGVTNRFIYPDESLPEGWRYGSTQKWHQKSIEENHVNI